MSEIKLPLKYEELREALLENRIQFSDALFVESALKNKSENPKILNFLALLFASFREGNLYLPAKELSFQPIDCPETLLNHLVFFENNRWYLRSNWELKTQFFKEWERLIEAEVETPIDENFIWQKIRSTSLHETQRLAIIKALNQPISFICGGPGTGKTYTATILFKVLSPFIKSYSIATAPTGKAASNLMEKLFANYFGTIAYFISKKTLFDAGLIIVDEGSMIDAMTMTKLLKEVRSGSRLVFLGDAEQLPPVDRGHLFSDLVNSSSHSIFLTHCYRAKTNQVKQLTQALLERKKILSNPLPSLKTIVEEALKYFIAVNSIEEGFRALEAYRLLTPFKTGFWGYRSLNHFIYQAHIEKCNDPFIPVLVTKNDEELGVYNGESGIYFFKQRRIYFSRGRTFNFLELSSFEWGYALSIHKAQGSEFEKVDLLIPEGSDRFSRELLYTGLTRAKNEIRIFGDEKTIEKMQEKSIRRVSLT